MILDMKGYRNGAMIKKIVLIKISLRKIRVDIVYQESLVVLHTWVWPPVTHSRDLLTVCRRTVVGTRLVAGVVRASTTPGPGSLDRVARSYCDREPAIHTDHTHDDFHYTEHRL